MSRPGRISFLITVDTEADDEWSRPPQPTYEGVAALRRLQELCEENGARPTYLVTYDVAADPASRDTLLALQATGRCEIGAHLHAWRTPPFLHALDQLHDKHPYLHEYPPELRRAKLEQITSHLERCLGMRPRSYRGGRWSLDKVTVAHLKRLGYVVDTTVTPYASWERHKGGRQGGVSFVYESPYPHVLRSGTDQHGENGLVEVPVTIRVRGRMSTGQYARLAAWARWARVGSALIRRCLRHTGIGHAVWLDPVQTCMEDIRWLVDKACEDSQPVLNMVFHSSELVPGGAPRVRTRRAAERVWERLHATLAYAAQKPGMRFMTLREFALDWRVRHAASELRVRHRVQQATAR